MAFLAGRYTATYNGLSLGQSADGWRLSRSVFKRLITGDAWAQAPQDAVYQGEEMTANVRLIEYDAAGVRSALFPYAATVWTIGTVGRTDVGSGLTRTLILTATALTPAATSPASITSERVILHESFPTELLYAPDLREVPLRFRVYPNSTTGVFAVEV